MVKKIAILIGLALIVLNVSAQEEKKLVRKGNKQYTNKNYSDAEINYRKALEKQAGSGVASYNLGNALYRQNKFEEAQKQFASAADANMNKKDIAKAYHNIGNSYLQMQKYQESIEAYKKALRNNPKDIESKYNLAFAQKKLHENPNQNQQNQQNKDNQNNQDKNNQDKNNQNQSGQDQKDKKDQNDQNKDQQDQDKQDNKDQNKDQQNQANKDNKMSKEDAERLLQAIQNDENNTQDKLKKEKAAGRKVNPEIDW